MNRASAGKPERKISETILDFGEPFLSEAITEDTTLLECAKYTSWWCWFGTRMSQPRLAGATPPI